MVGGGPAGSRPADFVEPSMFADVDNAYTIAREEILGPVVTLTRGGDHEDPAGCQPVSPSDL
jgi:aldehyde dehydrogenase (NAD+)